MSNMVHIEVTYPGCIPFVMTMTSKYVFQWGSVFSREMGELSLDHALNAGADVWIIAEDEVDDEV